MLEVAVGEEFFGSLALQKLAAERKP